LNDEVAAIRILDYYIPISLWLIYQIDLGKKNGQKGPVVVGVSIPQGGGKTTMTSCLEAALKVIDITTVVVSFDDFYLTYDD
jgi:pantothenate kinase-related protein Tda10